MASDLFHKDVLSARIRQHDSCRFLPVQNSNIIVEVLSSLLSYIKFLTRSKGAHSLHSPFVFNLYTQAIQGRETHPKFRLIEELRHKAMRNSSPDSAQAAGAGSRLKSGRTLGKVVQNSSIPPHFGRLLFRIVTYFRCKKVLELGTSTGFSTMYLSLGADVDKLITIEAGSERLSIAKAHIDALNQSNVEFRQGNFELVLPGVLSEMGQPDLVYLDGDHRREAVLANVKTILPFMHNDAVLVIDDIHWSGEMEQAWEEIKAIPEVTVTIDLFRMGIVFFRKEQVKEHFRLRFPIFEVF